MAQRRHLRPAAGHQLVVPLYRLNSCGLRAFSVLGPRLWNSLPRLLHDTSHSTTSFGHSLRHSFSPSTSAYSALGALVIMRYTNVRFTCLHVHTVGDRHNVSLQLQIRSNVTTNVCTCGSVVLTAVQTVTD